MTNDLILNGKDAWLEYRANISDGSVLELMIPMPKKDYVESNVRNAHGRIIRNTQWDDTTEKTLSFHIDGNGIENGYTLFKKFCDEVLAKGQFTLKSRYISDTFKLDYRSCTPISATGGLVKFSLKVVVDFFKQDNE